MKNVRSSRAVRWAGVGALALVMSATVHAASADSPSLTPAQAFDRALAVRQQSVDPDAEPAGKSATPVDASVARTDGAVGAQALTGATFVPINPYRAYDSRPYVDGFLPRGAAVWFDVITDVNGVQQIPANAVAVTYNLTATGTVGAQGYLAVFPADINWPGNSSINWFSANLSLANGGVVALGYLDGPGQITVYCGDVPLTGTDFIVDITGYYI